MANKEQLAILKQGVAAWNKWREENPDAEIDLRWAKLDGQNLSGANFHCADIRHASFKKAILVRTDFRGIRAGFNLLIKLIRLKCIIGNICRKIENFTRKLDREIRAAVDLLIKLITSKRITGNAYRKVVNFTRKLYGLINKYIINSILLDRNTKKYFLELIYITRSIYFLIIVIPFLFPFLLVPYKNYYIVNDILKIIDKLPKVSIVFISTFSLIIFTIILHDLSIKISKQSNINSIPIEDDIAISAAYLIFSIFSFYTRESYRIEQLNFLNDVPEIIAVSSSVMVFLISVFIFDILKKIMHIFRNRFMTRESKTMYFCANFTSADLTNAKFDRAKLDHTIFDNAILTGCSWRNSQGLLNISSCNDTILTDHDVCKLLVFGTGKGLFLKGKNMKGACLIDADLCDVDLRETDLRQVNLSGADITGTKLYGSARDNWIIDGIRCDYVYWDKDGKQRKPSDRYFRPGEFEELYKQLPAFEYIFEQGFTPLDPLIMDRVVQAVNERHKEFSLELVNFDKRGQPHATFTVCHLEHVEKAKQQITAGYEANRIAPERQEQLLSDFAKMLQTSLENQSKSLDIIKQLGGSAMGDTHNNTYNNYGQAAAMGPNASVTGNTFQQITADLSRLHEEMQRSAKTPEQRAAAEDVAKAAQAAQQQDESTMLRHLKNAGRFAFDCAKQIGTDVAAEYLKKTIGG